MTRRVLLPLYEHRRRGKPLDYFTPSGVESPSSGSGATTIVQPQQRANLNYSPSTFTVNSLSQIILRKNDNRKFLKLQNNNAFDVRINYGVPADSNSELLFANGGVIILSYNDVPVEAVHAVSDPSGSGLIYIVEGY